MRLASRIVKYTPLPKAENTNFRGSITLQLTSCLLCLDSAALLMLNDLQFYFFKPVKQEVSCTIILPPPMLSVLCLRANYFGLVIT